MKHQHQQNIGRSHKSRINTHRLHFTESQIMDKKVENYLENVNEDWNFLEIKTMLDVLRRHEDFKKNELERQRRLDVEVDYLKKILPRNGKSFLHCSMCNSIFIPIINSFFQCKICRLEICSNCVISFKSPSEINLCKICHAERLQKMKSGKWAIEKSDAEKQDMLLELGSRLSAMETEIRRSEQIIAERNQLSEVQRRFESILGNDEKDTRDTYSQFGSGRTSPSFGSCKSLSVDNISKFNIALGLKSKYKIKVSKFKDEIEESANDISSSNSTPSTSEPFFTISSINKSNRETNGYNKNPNKVDIDQNKRNSLSIRDSVSRFSVKSYSSDAFSGNLVIHGEIQVLIVFSAQQSHLQLTICECKELSIAKENGTNPFVKVYLLPDKSSSGKRKTSVKKGTLNPVFNEVVYYHIDKAALNGRTLNFSVWHHQSAHSRIFLGETNVALSNVDFNNPQLMRLPLRTRENVPLLTSLFLYKGEILVGLRYVNNTSNKRDLSITIFESGNFTIFIRNGRNLGDSKNVPSPYIKCRVLYKKSETSLRKTRVINETTNPTWDAEFIYNDINKDGLQDTEVELTVLSKKKFSKDYQLGKLYLGQTCHEKEDNHCKEKDVLLWRTFLNSTTSKVIEDYLPLRTSIE